MTGELNTRRIGWSLAGVRVTPRRRLAFFLTIDVALIAASVLAAFALRFSGRIPAGFVLEIVFVTALAIVSTVGMLLIYRIYRISWSYVGLRDIAVVAIAVAFSTLVVAAVAQWMVLSVPSQAFPRSIVLIQAPLAFLALSGFRISKRAWRTLRAQRRNVDLGVPTLLVGAGKSGEQVLKSLLDVGSANKHTVVGFLDDDPLARGTSIHGVPVLGPVDSLPQAVRTYRVDSVIICVATAESAFVRRVVERCREAGVKHVRIVPPVSQLVDGRVSFQATREVSLEDLLGREQVVIHAEDLRTLLAGRTVLVTGGAGTIGEELCRQVARHEPRQLVVLDVDETRLHDAALDLREVHPRIDVVEALVDVRDRQALAELFDQVRPQVVFHAAAYKHVPMMERYPLAALEVNVLGTLNTIEAAEAVGCEHFVLISTDKAVEPVNVMGATKRLAETVVLGGQKVGPRAMLRSAVRFGNVIGSRGSVIPIFERQLARGGPLTVTHPDVERYFMMTSEAVTLVLQAAALGSGGDLFVLDMGKPVRVLDVAREFCRLKGVRPDVDVPIVFIGLRPGERLTEPLHYGSENVAATEHPRVLRATDAWDADEQMHVLEDVRAIVAARDAASARALLEERFPGMEANALPAASPPT